MMEQATLRAQTDSGQTTRGSSEEFRDLVEKSILDWCASFLELDIRDPNQRLSLASLEAVDLNARIELEFGVALALEVFMQEASVGQLAIAVAEARDERSADDGAAVAAPIASLEALKAAPEERFDPFPLTEIQQAYLIGRETILDLGGVSTHWYAEFEGENVDVPRLELALGRVIERHDTLKSIITADGHQQVLAEVPRYEIDWTDLSETPHGATEAHLARVRDEMSHQLLPADQWPLFDVRATTVADGTTRMHFSLDLLIADAQSIAILMAEWQTFYADPDADLPPVEATYRDCVLAAGRLKQGPGYEEARSYWMARLDSLPAAPDLPTVKPTSDSDGRRVRRARVFEQGTWRQIKERAAGAGLTPSNLLCAAYAEVLSTWASDRRFTLNVTLGTRLPLHRDVQRMIGDFTSTVLLEIDNSQRSPLQDRALAIQRTLRSDMEHRLMGGVEVQREMAKTIGGGFAVMPVVFTSLLGVNVPDIDESSGFPAAEVYGVSQTPQVQLDHVVVERGGELHITWDAVEDLFPNQMLDAMFNAYCDLLTRLAGDPRVFDESRPAIVPAKQLDHHVAINRTDAVIDEQLLLHTLVDERCAESTRATAIVSGDRSLTYEDLDRRANQVARRLQERGVMPGSLVPVVMQKGWEQVVAVLGVLRAGGAYVPIDSCVPERRLHELLEQAEAGVVLTQSSVDEDTAWPTLVTTIRVDDDPALERESHDLVACHGEPGDLAYVIFTSGSTGTPKGVMIEHGAAVNTIVDCIERFDLDEHDRVLALSSLSFDLSVFDVFAILAVGGTVVIPEPSETRDPIRWAELVREHGVTVWNSVPALFDMFVEYASGDAGGAGQSLRLAMLSGDWIPIDLPDRARLLNPGLQLIGLGGATECSIWSIRYPIGTVDPTWASIPYGRPMANQTMHVLDEHLAERPVWAVGELYIGGRGLARGYLGDDAKTQERFITRPFTGERLYRTGDLGRHLPSGEIEFLGRADSQVKIRGHRIEPGEIEAALREHPEIRSALVVAAGERTGPKRLVAYLVAVDSEIASPGDLRDFLKYRLPDYMIPSAFVPVSDWPLTANGKVDVESLPTPVWESSNAVSASTNGVSVSSNGASKSQGGGPNRNLSNEEVLTGLFAEILKVDEVGPDDSFFDLGGDSLLGLRLIAKAGAMGLRIDPEVFFEHPTVTELSALAPSDQQKPAKQGVLTGPTELTPSQLWFFEQDFEDIDHWNGMWPLLSVAEQLDPMLLGAALHKVMVHHDMLRARFTRNSAGWSAAIIAPDELGPVPLSTFDYSDLSGADLERAVEETCERCQASLSLSDGPTLRVSYFDLGEGRSGRLHVAAHWVTLDYYSSRIFFEDLQSAYLQLRRGEDPLLPAKTTPFPLFSQQLIERSNDHDVIEELVEWMSAERAAVAPIPLDHDLGPNRQATARRVMISLPVGQTRALVGSARRDYGCEVREMILTALARALANFTGQSAALVEIEAHGRDQMILGADMSRSVGRTSTLWPAYLDVDQADDAAQAIARVVERMRSHPNRGMGYGLLRYLSENIEIRRGLQAMPAPAVGLNYWGQVDEYFTGLIEPSAESPGRHRSDAGMRPRILDVLGFVAADQLTLVWTYSENLHLASTAKAMAEATVTELQWLLAPDNPGQEPAVAQLVDESRPMESDGRWRLPTAASSAQKPSGAGA